MEDYQDYMMKVALTAAGGMLLALSLAKTAQSIGDGLTAPLRGKARYGQVQMHTPPYPYNGQQISPEMARRITMLTR